MSNPALIKRLRLGDDFSDIAPLILCFDANRGVTNAGSGKVSAWSDVSGNNFNMAQSTGALRPTVTTNADGFGNSKVTFNGTTEYMITSAAIGPQNYKLIGDKITYFAVIQITQNTLNRQNWLGRFVNSGGAQGPMIQGYYNATGDYRLAYRASTSTGSSTALPYGDTNIYNTLAVCILTWDGAAITGSVNGVRQTFTGAGTPVTFDGSTTPWTMGCIGAPGTPTQFFGGDIYIAGLYSGVLSFGQITNLEKRLASRYQISI
jgi:hypothetical protein